MSQWFNTDPGKAFINATKSGKFAYIWEVLNDDGKIVRQFEDPLFQQLIDDDAPVPANLDEIRGSVDRLDVRKVKEFYLLPTGAARAYVPLLQPVRLVVNLSLGEKFISYWLADYNYIVHMHFFRHVVGISKPVNGASAKFFAVLNPIGHLTIATDDNQSYAGE